MCVPKPKHAQSPSAEGTLIGPGELPKRGPQDRYHGATAWHRWFRRRKKHAFRSFAYRLDRRIQGLAEVKAVRMAHARRSGNRVDIFRGKMRQKWFLAPGMAKRTTQQIAPIPKPTHISRICYGMRWVS